MYKKGIKTLAVCMLAVLANSTWAANSKVLNIYNWSDYIAPDTVKNFEKQTGIKVRYDVYDSNEILQAKVLTGHSGYDLVVPGNPFLAKQIQAGVYQKLDKSKLTNYGNLDPALLQKMSAFDPGNNYGVPWFYGMNTLGINVNRVKKALGNEPMPANQWDLLFDPKYVAKLKTCGVSVLDSPSETLPVAMHYLGKNPNSAAEADWKVAAAAFQKVRPFITRFSSSGYINEFAGGSLCLVLGYGGDLNIAKRRAEQAKNGQQLEVLVPKQGVEMWIDSWAIPKDAPHPENALLFLNYILQPKVAAAAANTVTYATPNKAATPFVEQQYLKDPSIYPTAEIQKNSFFVLPVDAKLQRVQTRLWTDIKTRT